MNKTLTTGEFLIFMASGALWLGLIYLFPSYAFFGIIFPFFAAIYVHSGRRVYGDPAHTLDKSGHLRWFDIGALLLMVAAHVVLPIITPIPRDGWFMKLMFSGVLTGITWHHVIGSNKKV